MGKSTTHSGFQPPLNRPAFLPNSLWPIFYAQRADGVVDHLGAIRAEEDDVAVLRAGALDQFGQRGIVQVLDDGRLQALAALGHVVDLDVGQALGAVDADELRVGVDLAARHLAAALHAQRHDAAARGGGGEANTLKSTSRMTSVMSVNCRLTRRSALSEP